MNLVKCEEPNIKLAKQEQAAAKVKDSLVIYCWTTTPPRRKLELIGEFIFLVVFIIIGIIIAFKDHEYAILYGMAFTSWGTLLVYFLHHIINQPKTYNFSLSSHGIYASVHENIPDRIYSITRSLARLGILICIIALFSIGPMAFLGGAAFSLLAPKYSKLHKTRRHFYFPIHRYIDFLFYRQEWRISIHTNYPAEKDWEIHYAYRCPQELFIEPRKLYQLITYLKTNFNIITAKEVHSFKDVTSFISRSEIDDLNKGLSNQFKPNH
ncbi:hypothetical protein [Vibrio sp. 10N]|uniref:hypothetical protein n=1 Tax=Vibrio sp. 10N TaxID=3058938 RepID=UPI0030C75FBB